MSERFFLLKIRLLGIEPEIWRRFVVPADISLDRLHDVIQIVMGWRENDLHEFFFKKKRFTEYPRREADGPPCGCIRLNSLVNRKGQSFRYLYGFEDWWEHQLEIENSRYPGGDWHFGIECLDGARACPPDELEGIKEYREILEALNDTEHEDHEDSLEWYNKNVTIEAFDVDAVNWELTKYQRWSRDRYLLWKERDDEPQETEA
jgi:hypothetical protein